MHFAIIAVISFPATILKNRNFYMLLVTSELIKTKSHFLR